MFDDVDSTVCYFNSSCIEIGEAVIGPSYKSMKDWLWRGWSIEEIDLSEI